MVNEELLRNMLKEKGLKLKFIAEKMGLTPQGLSLKMSNVNEFTVSEAYKLSSILGLDSKELNSQIFLPNSVT